MAYQSKKHRKFLATSLTAAMVASAVAPAVGFAAEFKDVKEGSFYHEYVKALSDAKIIDGRPDGSFDLGGKVTRAEASKMIANILKLDTEKAAAVSFADVDQKAWYAKYVNALYAAKLIDGKSETTFDPNGTLTRAEFAKMVVAAYKIDTKKETEVPFTDLAEGKWYVEYVSALYAEKLITGTTATTFSPDATVKRADFAKLLTESDWALGTTLPKKETPVTAPEVTGVSATNLKEIVVTFNQAVDKTTAENVDAYTLVKGVGTVVLDSAQLQADGKTVILTPNAALANQATDYKLSVAGVKQASGTELFTATDVKFTPVDAALPTVVAVEGLGNKAIKVTFSEPVDFLATQVSSTFKIDDKVVSGIPTVVGRTVTIELFNTLTDGEHTLDINNNIKDYAGYQLVTTSQKFNVTADTTAPTIAEVKNVTLESATVVFSEDVKKDAATLATNYYWMEGSTKRTANNVEQIDARTYKVNFTNKLPGYTTDLYVINVADFSGNKVAAGTKVAVNAKLDQERPTVLSSVFDKNTNKKVTLTFSKAIDASSFKASNVVVKDKDGKAVSNGYRATITGKTVVVDFTTALKAGSYTFEISGLKDTTLLQNAMEPYTVSLVVADLSKPTASDIITGTLPNYIITFDKKMDLTTEGSILNPDNYYVTYTVNGNQVLGKLPSGTNLAPTSDAKGVIITFPSGVTAVHKITVQGVKSESGNVLNNYAKEYDLSNPAHYASNLAITKAKATGTKTVLVKMNQPVGNVLSNGTGFAVTGSTVTKAEVDPTDSTVVKLTLSTPLAANVNSTAVKVTTTANANVVGITGATLVTDGTGKGVADAIKATAKAMDSDDNLTVDDSVDADASIEVVDTAGTHTITVNFTENITELNSAKLGENFKLYKEDGKALEYGRDYSVSISTSTAVITLNATATGLVEYDGTLQVVFNNANENIVDDNANAGVDFDGSSLVNANPAVDFDTADGTVAGPDAGTAAEALISVNEPITLSSAKIVTAGSVAGWNQVGDVLKLTFDDSVLNAFTTDKDLVTPGFQIDLTDVQTLLAPAKSGAITLTSSGTSFFTVATNGKDLTLTIVGADLTTGLLVDDTIVGVATSVNITDDAANTFVQPGTPVVVE